MGVESCLIMGQMPRPVGHFDNMRLAHGIVHKPYKRVLGLGDELGPIWEDHVCSQT